MVKDINVGAASGVASLSASAVTVLNNSLYFIGNNGSSGQELWVSDGTSAGTNLVADITSGSNSTVFGSFSNAGGRVWFTATTTAAGRELWTTDGTSAGTVMVKDINPGTSGSAATFLGSLGTNVIFSAIDGVNGQELWISDGSSSGTVMIADINPGSANGVTTAFPGTTLNGVFYFPANNGTNGFELWRTDLTSAGTQMVTDLGPGSFSGYYTGLTSCGSSLLYFIGNDGTAGYEPYISVGNIGPSPTTSTTTTIAPTTTTSTTTTVATTTTTTTPTTTVAPTTTTVPPTTVAPAAATTTTTTVAATTTTKPPTTTTTIAKTTYTDWTISATPSSVSPGEKFSLEVSVTCPNKMNNGMYLGDPTGTPLFRYEIKNSSGTSFVGGYAYKGKQVLSNNNYTVTWTQSVVAPSTNGNYSVQVYSTGAAADFIYCKMQMNARTNGPTVSVTVSALSPTTTTSTTTIPTTTTTVPPLPAAPAVIERANPLEPVALIDGKPVAAEIVQSPVSLQVTVEGVVATVGGVSNGENALALTETGEIRVTNKEKVRISLDGLMPNSRVDVWLYTRNGKDQEYLGSYGTTANGGLAEEIKIPTGGLSGSADLVVSGTNASGKKVTVGIPMQIIQVVKSSGATTSVLAGLLFAVGGFFIFLVLRRRRDDEVEAL
jgi:ELWxxDGT repeat protein